MEAVGRLTSGGAHDFNNLLTVILGNTDALAEDLAGDARLRPLAELTREAAERAAELTRRLLAFSRRQPLQPEVVDIDELVAGMHGLMRRTLGDDIEIEIASGEKSWPVSIDPAQLEAGRGPADPSAGRPDYLRMARTLGATRTIEKPFTGPQLPALVAECLSAGTER
jgi:signal transduction histidine kinase